jgi:hypothetical protein
LGLAVPNEDGPENIPYKLRVRRATRADFCRAWTDHRVLGTVLAAIYTVAPIGYRVVHRALQRGAFKRPELMEFLQSVAFTLGLALVTLAGSYILSRLKATRAVDTEFIARAQYLKQQHTTHVAATEKSLSEADSALAAEKERNRKPGISVQIVAGCYWIVSYSDSRLDDQVFRTRLIYIALEVEFFNASPQVGSVDKWRLVVETPNGEIAAATPAPGVPPPSGLLESRVPKASMEPHLRVDHGITIRRCDHFVVKETLRLTLKQASGSEDAEAMPLRLFQGYSATLKFTATDSFGQDAETRRETSPVWFRFVLTQPWEDPGNRWS